MAKKRSEGSSTNIIELKKLLADLEKSILATKKQIVAEDKKSADYLEKMAKLDAVRSKNRNEYQRITRQIDQIEKESQKRAEKELKVRQDLAKQIEKENKELEKNAKKEEANLKTAEKKQKLREKELSFEEAIGELQEKSAILMKSINSDIQKKADKLKISGQFVTQIADKTDEIKKLFKGTAEETKAFEKTLKYTNDNASKIDKLSAKILENMENMKKKGYQLIDTYETERDLKEQAARLDLNREKMGENRYAMQKKMLDAQKKEFEKLKQVNQKMAEKSKQAKETRENIVGWIAAVPLGAFLMNKMGLGKIITGTKTVKETIKGWGTAIAGFTAALPFMALAGIFSLIITVIKKLVGMVFELDQDLSDLSKQFSVSRNRAEGLFSSLGKLALRMNVVGVNVKELAKTLEDLTEEYGTNLDRLESASMKNGMLQGISLLREKWQLTNEEALNFYKNSNMMGVGMDKLAQASILVNKNVLNARQALKAVSNIPQVIALGFKGSVRELAAFAGQAKVMGIDLKTFHDALKSAMDVESSLDTQFTAEVLTGVHHKQMDAYRDAAMKGEDDRAFKIKMEMYQEYIDRYGKNLKGMYVPYREVVAKLFGESEEDFVNGIARFGQLQEQFGKGSLKAIQKMQESNKKLVGKGGAAGFILGETQAKEGASVTEKFEDDMEKIKIAAKDALMPLVSELHSFYDEISKSLKPMVLDMIKVVRDELVPAIKGLMGVLKEMWGVFSGFLEFMGILKTETDENGNQVKKLNTEWFNMWNILGSIALFFGAKGLLTWGLKKTGEALGELLKKGWTGFKDWVKGSKQATEAIEEVGKKSTKVAKETAKTGTSLVDDAAKTGGATMKGRKAKYSWKPPASSTSVVDDAAKVASKGSKFLKVAGKFAKVLPIIGTAITAYDGITGAMDASKTLQDAGLVKKGAPVTNKQVAAGAMGGVLESMTMGGLFGLIPGMDKENLTKGLYQNYARQHEKYKKGEYLSLAGDIALNPLSALMHFLPGDDDNSPAGVQKKQQAAQKPQQAVAQQAAGLSRQSAEELKKLNEQMQLLGGDRTWQASKAVNQVAKSTTALSDAFSYFYKSGAHLTFSYVVKTFDSVNNSKIYSFASGITSVSNSIGDLSKKLSKLDVAKLERVSQITNPGIMSTITGAAGSLFGSVKSFFGFGGSSAQQTSTVPSSTTTVGANKNAGSNVSQTSSGVSVNVNTVALEQKIDKLIGIIGQMASQPTYIKIGDRTVEAISSEIDFKKNKEVGLQRYGSI